MSPARIGAQSAHPSGTRVRAQARYADTPEALATAHALLARKCRNQWSLLRSLLPYRVRTSPEAAAILGASMVAVRNTEEILRQVVSTRTRRDLFLLEARGARAYWRGVRAALRVQVGGTWTRRYPHAEDPVNVLLNIGYTLLARRLHAVLLSAGLLPEIGILHSPRGKKDPFVYDFMELFRQPAVDAVVLTAFTRRKRPMLRMSSAFQRRVIARLVERWEKPFRTRGVCLPLHAIAERESIACARSLVRGAPWKPYRHPWGHGWSCAGYRLPRTRKQRLLKEVAVVVKTE